MTMKLKIPVLLASTVLLSVALAAQANADPEREQAQANFLEADINQDEQLDLAEFTTFINLNADHGLGRAATVRTFGMYGRAFGRADANGDGVVERQELAEQAQR